MFLTFTILKVGYLYEPWILGCVTTGCDLVLVQYCTAFVLSCLLLYSCFRWHWFIYVYQRIGALVLVLMMIHRVIKKSVCTWRLQYSNSPHTIDDLKMAITEYIHNVHHAILNTVVENTVRRVKCLDTFRTSFVTFCIVIIRCTETFWSSCISLILHGSCCTRFYDCVC